MCSPPPLPLYQTAPLWGTKNAGQNIPLHHIYINGIENSCAFSVIGFSLSETSAPMKSSMIFVNRSSGQIDIILIDSIVDAEQLSCVPVSGLVVYLLVPGSREIRITIIREQDRWQ